MKPIELIIRGIIYVLVAIFAWKVWPIIKEWAIVKQALTIVHQIEEDRGGGDGVAKFVAAKNLLQEFLDKLGWKIDVEKVAGYITSAVGMLHAEQGVLPKKKARPPDDAQ